MSGGNLTLTTKAPGSSGAWPQDAPMSTTDANSSAAQVWRMYDAAEGPGQHPGAAAMAGWVFNLENACLPGGSLSVTPTAVEAASFATATADNQPTYFNTENMAALEGMANVMLTYSSVIHNLGGVNASDTAFVTAMYQSAFRRLPSNSELNIWVGNLQANETTPGTGWTRAGMLALFSEWHDHRDVMPTDPNSAAAQVIRMYDVVLGRMPTPTEVEAAVANLGSIWAAGGTGAVVPSAAEAGGFAQPVTDGLPAMFNTENMAALEGMAAAMLPTNTKLGPSTESDTAFVQNLYLSAFKRAPASSEVTAWLNNFAAGWTRAGMTALFSEWHDHRAAMATVTPPNLAWSGDTGSGLFSILPQASADGRTVTIASFAASENYVVTAPGAQLIATANNFVSAAGSSSAVTIAGSGVIWIPDFGYVPRTDTGPDIFIGGSGADTLIAGDGSDWLQSGGPGNDTIQGGAGTDVLLGGTGNDAITAGSGADYIAAGAGTNTIHAGSGTVTIAGGPGTAIFNGAGGNNTVSYANSTSAVYVNLAARVSYGGYANGDVFNDIRNVVGSNYDGVLEGSASTATPAAFISGVAGLIGAASSDLSHTALPRYPLERRGRSRSGRRLARPARRHAAFRPHRLKKAPRSPHLANIALHEGQLGR